MSTKPSMQNMNVLKKPLGLFSQKPMTGFYRDGYCRTGLDDTGNHAIAGVLTQPFLNFTASRGNDLASIGLTPGCKWCLCASRWKEALDAYTSGAEKDENVVPRVFLHATHESALKDVKLEDLRRLAAKGELDGKGGGAETPSQRDGASVKEGDMSGYDVSNAPSREGGGVGIGNQETGRGGSRG